MIYKNNAVVRIMLILLLLITGLFFVEAQTGCSNNASQTGEIDAVEAVEGPGPSLNPAPPTNVIATPGNGQVTISWDLVSNATSYNIYTGISGGGALIQANVTPSYVNTELTNGAQYFYQVTAVNAAGESERSVEVSAIPTAGSGSGGVGEGERAVPDITPPTVTLVSPAHEASNVDVWSNIVVEFSEPMKRETINADTLEIIPLPGVSVTRVDFADAEGGGLLVTFTLSNRLDYGREHTIQISDSAQDLAGLSLAEPRQFGFTTGMRQWRETTVLNTIEGGSLTEPHVAIDNNSNVLTTWIRKADVAGEDLLSSYYSNSNRAWNDPAAIDQGNNSLDALDMVMNNNGDAVAVWRSIVADVGPPSIATNSFSRDAGMSWGLEGVLQAASDHPIFSPKVQIQPNSNAAASVRVNDQKISLSTRPADGAWSPNPSIGPSEGENRSVDIDLDNLGRRAITWVDNGKIMAKFDVNLDESIYSLGTNQNPQIAYLNDEAMQIIVWEKTAKDAPDDPEESIGILSRVYNGGWLDTEALDVGSNPHMSTSLSGDVVVLYVNEANQIYSRTHSHIRTNPLGDPRFFQYGSRVDVGEGFSSNPRVAINSTGTLGIAAWVQNENLSATNYIGSGLWSAAVSIIDTGVNPVDVAPQIAINSNGDAALIWQKGGSIYVKLYR